MERDTEVDEVTEATNCITDQGNIVEDLVKVPKDE